MQERPMPTAEPDEPAALDGMSALIADEPDPMRTVVPLPPSPAAPKPARGGTEDRA